MLLSLPLPQHHDSLDFHSRTMALALWRENSMVLHLILNFGVWEWGVKLTTYKLKSTGFM